MDMTAAARETALSLWKLGVCVAPAMNIRSEGVSLSVGTESEQRIAHRTKLLGMILYPQDFAAWALPES